MNIDMNYVKDFMIEILNIPGCGGCTDVATERIKKEFDSFGIKTWLTKKGALVGTMEGECDDEQKLVSAHIDTLGAVVKDIKPNGRLKVTNVGGFAWQSVEGENVTIQTFDGREYTGTLLPEKASIHVHSDEVRELARTEETMEVRIDEDVHTKEDTEKLGIHTGDYVLFDPRAAITKSGYIKSRYLDDKACVAAMFGVIKYLKDNNIKPKYTTHFYISNYEEIGHGVTVIPEKVSEFLALDIGTVGAGHTSDEHCVTILAKDSRTPYDFKFRKKLVEIAEKNGIGYKVDVHFRYGSDASTSILQGFDVNYACIGMGVDATHHYERTHLDGVKNNVKLLAMYLLQ
jgi:Cellulase M and related proteins